MEREQLERAIAALEAQRAVLGDEVVETMLAAAREKLSALHAQPPPSDRRKYATILFADVAGFTSLSETLDPEVVRDIMQALWQRLDHVVVRHGGTIDKHMGDAIMAVWGVQSAHEDDPERAVRAAFDLLEETRDWRLEIGDWPKVAISDSTLTQDKSQPPVSNLESLISNPQSPLSLRVGVNTGMVLLGRVGLTDEYTALGDAVNVAQRLQGAAPIGGIFISETTYRQVRGVVETEPQGALLVKGKTEPVQAYRALRLLPRAFHIARRGVEGVVTRTLGREAELARLRETYQDVVATRRPRVVTLVGEAGVGKSRLVDELEQWIISTAAPITLLKGRADETQSGVPFTLFRDVLFNWAGIRDADTAAQAQARLEHSVAAVMGPDSREQAHFIGHLVGLDFSTSAYITGRPNAAAIRKRASFYLAQLVRALAPVVLFLEDIHWADAASLDLIEDLHREWTANLQVEPHTSGAAVLIVAAARSTLLEQRPAWDQANGYLRLDVQPLNEGDSRRLLAEILQRVDSVPLALQRLVVATAEGNPFFMEELVKVLIDQGIIQTAGSEWRVETTRLPDLRVPPTLTALIQARLDSLHPVEQDTLRRAAVAGQVFWDALVAYLADEQDVSNTLGLLSRRELVVGHAVSAFDGADEYGFKHSLLRDVTYESILLRDRPVYHGRAADWLIQRSGERAAEFAAVIGEHLERAGRASDAVAWFVRAGDQAHAVYATPTALALYERALRLTTNDERVAPSGPPRSAILLRLGQTLAAATEWPSARARLDEARALACATLDHLTQARCDEEIGALLAGQGHFDEALDRLEQAQVGYEHAGATDALPRVAVLIGTVYGRWGQRDPARHWLELGLQAARAVGDHQAEARALNGLGNVAAMSSDYAQAQAWFEQCLALRRKLYDKVGVAEVLGNLGIVAARQGRLDQAIELYGESARLCRALGDRPAAAGALNNLGLVAVRQGDFDRATALYRESLALFRSVGALSGVALALDNLGGAYLLRHALDEAASALRESLTMREAIGDRHGLAMTYSHLGSIALLREDVGEAAKMYRLALQAGQVSDHRRAMAVALAGLGLTMRLRGEDERGARLAGAAQALVARLNVTLDPEEVLIIDRAAQAFAADNRSFVLAGWQSGQALSLEDALALASDEQPSTMS